MGHHVDFWHVTQDAQDALDFIFDMHGIDDPDLHKDLMEAYLKLDYYSEVPKALSILKNRGFRLAILSNGTPAMLEAAVKNSGIEALIDKIYSVEGVGIFKPDPRVYQVALDGMQVRSAEIVFQSSNAWDASGVSAFGFKVAWVNRFGQSKERLPGQPDVEIRNLIELTKLLSP